MDKAKLKVEFQPTQMKSGLGWYVLVKLPLSPGLQPHLGGFKTEAEATEWIKDKSTAWLKGYENGKYV